MALEGPRLVYARTDWEEETGDALTKALRLAREVEELLEETASGVRRADAHASSTRIARAMAASLVDELEAMTRTLRAAGVS